MNSKENISHPENELPEEFFQIIFSQAGDGIFLIDEHGVMLEMNPRGCEILGYSRDELRGQPVFQFQPADEVAPILKKLAQLVVEKRVTAESAFLRKDGVRVPVEITGKMLSNKQIIGMLRDITERKQTEQALIESEQKFRSLVEYSPDGIVIVDENGLIVEWNRGQEEITGIQRFEVVGKCIWDIQFQFLPEKLRSPATLARLKHVTLEALRTGQGPELHEPSERILHLKDGRQRNVEFMTYTYGTSLGYRIGSVARDITRRKQVEMLLEHLAMHDPLTDLPNRQLLQDRLEHGLERAKREKRETVAVMMLDLDHFKEVNDTYGHAFGDQVLRIAAQRLQACLRKSDTASRVGGDEFILILTDIRGSESVIQVAQKVLNSISVPMNIEGRAFEITTSIGISLFSSRNVEASTLLRQADLAMYEAKKARNCVKLYHSTDDS
jgi:diguanylate cyclase (GGDEF)-like protein/PAS domain S-box-containing protein